LIFIIHKSILLNIEAFAPNKKYQVSPIKKSVLIKPQFHPNLFNCDVILSLCSLASPQKHKELQSLMGFPAA
jgi:hypothetical protein